jgi:hypothetical protein
LVLMIATVVRNHAAQRRKESANGKIVRTGCYLRAAFGRARRPPWASLRSNLVHKASCTTVVLGPSGKKLGSHVVETNASVLIELLKTIPRPRHLCFEEGTQS